MMRHQGIRVPVAHAMLALEPFDELHVFLPAPAFQQLLVRRWALHRLLPGVGSFYTASAKSLFLRVLIFKFKHLHYWSRNCLSL
jgi:hypothetical protein